jgi:hypothetical protein
MAKSKYQKYVLKEPRINLTQKKKTDNPTFGLSEELMADFTKLDINFNVVGILGSYVLADPPHKHNCDEILFFMSADPDDPDNLGGEVEIAMGDEWEKHTINTSAVICIPAGVQHCPVFAKKVDRPFYFGHLLLAASYNSSQTPKQ